MRQRTHRLRDQFSFFPQPTQRFIRVLQNLHWFILPLEALACILETEFGVTSCRGFVWPSAPAPNPGLGLCAAPAPAPAPSNDGGAMAAAF